MKTGQKLSLIMHSLGNYFLTHLVVNGNNQYMKERIFDNIVMNAPAVRTREHGEVVSQIGIQDRLYVALNKGDFVLRGAQMLTSGKMLGNLAMEPLAPNTRYVDFSDVAGREHTYFAGYHDFEFDLPAVGSFYDNALHGKEVDLSDESLFSPNGSEQIFHVKGSSHQKE